MNLFLKLSFLFFIGSVCGWFLELFYRRFFSKNNPEHRWINPGFCTGPYLPLYGCGLCLLYLIASLERFEIIADPIWERVALFAVMAVCMTAIEYLAGWAAIRFYKVRLWDYSNEWANLNGIICPKFSLAWAALGALYYFFVHPHILNALRWLSENLAFSFVVGMFFGIFVIDVAQAASLMARLKQFAEENNVIVHLEAIKTHIRDHHDRTKEKYHFFMPFHSRLPLNEHLKALVNGFEKRLPHRH